MKITQKELNEALMVDVELTVKDISESYDIYVKGQNLLSENKITKEELNVVNEGLWEKVKYGLSKLGRYKAGGKILGNRLASIVLPEPGGPINIIL